MDNKKDELIKKILGSLRPQEEPKEMTLEERMLAIMRKRKEAEEGVTEEMPEEDVPNIAPGAIKLPSLGRTKKPTKAIR